MTKTIEKPNKQIKITTTELKDSYECSVFIFAIENTNNEFESYIDSLMNKEIFYGEPIY